MKVLLIPDRPNWAYDILAQSIKTHSKHEIEIQYILNLRRDPKAVDFSDFDVVFFFLWYDAMQYGPQVKGFSFYNTCVGVHSIASWVKRNRTVEHAAKICDQFAATGYISQEIGDLLGLDRGFFTPNGVESSLFHPSPTLFEKPLRLMWVGNPSSRHHGGNKGFHSIVKPVLEAFDAGDVVLHTASPDNPVAREHMGEFYRSNHALICSSRTEGGPMPVIEALACGRPVITTSVGIVPEVVVHGTNGLVYERSRQGLKSAIEGLLASPESFQAMASHAPESVTSRLAEVTVLHYDKMFEFVHQRAGEDA